MNAHRHGKKMILITAIVFAGAGGIVGVRTNRAGSNEARPAQVKEEIALGSFYVVTQAVSDKGTPWADKILDVRAEVEGVRVREIRIAPMNRNCAHNVTVKAVERLLPNTTVAKVAGKF